MQRYLYLSLIPEALILSQLPPEQFGRYTAIGSKRQIEGPAVFFQVDPQADLSAFRMAAAEARCHPHPDGSPRRSVYVAIWDVLRRVPLSALQRAFLTTPAGHTLGLDPAEWKPEVPGDDNYLYQELGPVYPRVASTLEPRAFCERVTAPEELISLPVVAFIDLKLGGLAFVPERPNQPPMPYQHLEHIRECFRALRQKTDRPTKIVNRGLRPDILFYLVRSGLFVGGGGMLRYFPLPPEEVLETKHHLWWHSAQAVRGY
jgi:hypothetical protein